ncbi:hypothetical protein [Natronobacterium gregoryi]|uniref:Uncharacterized protein n=2 Tax=Natronobacterium gregoryi TaxID=44930 RepID=L0AJ60_NATGS|nr:hypothetical protein [Natronobacterium gregoryi]AFZ73484.1 hypothetical protein Natgr_2308 [Natronobacterium gregoryi SP2]ELY68337.1 hypothetical protein C490_09693 [Natronobacterium gregoryi SP2]PLK20502.1 hypothetical protein CYV19_09235 [Natronobacterium gregoryi SP2]SFI70966.1 hypothetical protein SAMN05443661_10419 [Natronobacterium gregoryi]
MYDNDMGVGKSVKLGGILYLVLILWYLLLVGIQSLFAGDLTGPYEGPFFVALYGSVPLVAGWAGFTDKTFLTAAVVALVPLAVLLTVGLVGTVLEPLGGEQEPYAPLLVYLFAYQLVASVLLSGIGYGIGSYLG